MAYALTDQRIINLVPTLFELVYNDEAGTPARGRITLDSRDMTFDEDFTTLTTQGTTVTHEKDTLNVFRINGTNAVHQLALVQAALGVATTSGITGVAARNGYDGQYNSRRFELVVTLTGTDLDDGTDVNCRLTFWNVNFKQFRPFASATAKQVPEQTWQLTAAQAKTDILNVAIVGLKNSASGDIYSFDVLV